MTKSETMDVTGPDTDGHCEYLTLVFSPLSVPLRSRWRNNGLSADFVGDYVKTFLPSEGTGLPAIHHSVTYVANELLENAMKYHERQVDVPIRIHLELASDRITVSASNGVGSEPARCYRDFVETIRNEEPSELIFRQLEANVGDESSTRSCLGLLTMINDHGAQLDWRFESHPTIPEVMTVTTSAVLSLRTLAGAAA
jgi:hypothetical protein